MWPLIISIVTVGLAALCHRYRGEGAKYFERWTVAICVAVGMYFFGLALSVDDPINIINSLLSGIGMFIFLCQPWGRWYTIGNMPRDLGGPASPYEKIIEAIFGFIKDRKLADILCWILSAYLFTLPLIIVNAIWAILPPLMVAMYAISWKISSDMFVIRNAETASGGLFGVIALITNYVTYSPAAQALLNFFG